MSSDKAWINVDLEKENLRKRRELISLIQNMNEDIPLGEGGSDILVYLYLRIKSRKKGF